VTRERSTDRRILDPVSLDSDPANEATAIDHRVEDVLCDLAM